jgi:hypothetical protein
MLLKVYLKWYVYRAYFSGRISSLLDVPSMNSCRDVNCFVVYSGRQELVETPFAPLTQGYQTCRNDPFTTFVTAAGASAGNVTLLSPAGVAVVLCILALYQMFTGVYNQRL